MCSMIDIGATFGESINKHDWPSVSKSLADATKDLGTKENSEKVSSKTINDIAHALQVAQQMLSGKNSSSDVVTAITESFRFLRNACATDSNVQRYIVETNIFLNTSDLLNVVGDVKDSGNGLLPYAKVAVQFLGNAIVGNSKNQNIAWKIFHPHLRKFLSCDDPSLKNCVCMVIYNILLGEADGALKCISEDLPKVLDCYIQGSDFAGFIVEFLVVKGELETVYQELTSDHRLQLLDTVWSLVMDNEKSSETKQFPLTSMLFLVERLKQDADSVLTIVDQGVTAEPRETLRLLDVLACASARSLYLTALQADKALLISVSHLLKNVTEIGKAEESNVFSSVQRLSEMKQSSVSVQEHPVFGFKAALVRLIGNLCHQHTINQNQVRELGCLSAVLDCCNIDVYNPLLLQWGVLAVRNLLENNPGNQRVVAGLVAKGPAPATVLHELGLELHQDEGGSLRIAPLKRT